MTTKIKSDKIVLSDGLFDGYIYIEDGKIQCVSAEDKTADHCYDHTGKYVSAGFIDIHTHGGGGYAFEKSVDDIVMGCNFHLAHGTTSICPTISAAPMDSMAVSVKNVAEAMKDDRVKGTILGSHLEGPYLSREQAGKTLDEIDRKQSEERAEKEGKTTFGNSFQTDDFFQAALEKSFRNN